MSQQLKRDNGNFMGEASKNGAQKGKIVDPKAGSFSSGKILSDLPGINENVPQVKAGDSGFKDIRSSEIGKNSI